MDFFRASEYFDGQGEPTVRGMRLVELRQPEARDFVINEGHRTMPQIYINDKSIGGYDQLKNYDLSNIQ